MLDATLLEWLKNDHSRKIDIQAGRVLVSWQDPRSRDGRPATCYQGGSPEVALKQVAEKILDGTLGDEWLKGQVGGRWGYELEAPRRGPKSSQKGSGYQRVVR